MELQHLFAVTSGSPARRSTVPTPHQSHSSSYQFADFVLAVWSRAGRGPDHGGGLVVGQLLDAPLSRHDVAHLQTTTTIIAGLSVVTL